MAKEFNIREWKKSVKLLNEQCAPSIKHYDGPEGEGIMARSNAIEASNDASDVANMIGPDTNLPEWLEAKITLAATYLNKAKDYLSNYDASRMNVNLNEQDNFDSRFKDAMSGAGFSDEEQDDIMSKDIGDGGSSFPGDKPGYSPAAAKARDYIETFRKEYREMSDDQLDEFSVEIINHLLDNTAAAAAAKIYFAKKGI